VRVCVVDGCDREANRSRGMCGPHYSRLHIYGDPLAPRPETRPVRWLRAAIADATDECVIYPFGLSQAGYGKIKWNGRTLGAHRVALELAAGPCPADKQVAAHSCRSKACVNPNHLRWATHQENHLDKWRDGTMPTGLTHPLAVLDVPTVIKIRSLAAQGFVPSAIANELGIDHGTTRDVIKRRTWAWVEEVAA
jgi:hypothetical protein